MSITAGASRHDGMSNAQPSSSRGGTREEAIDLDDEFDDELLLDEEAEQSLLQLEEEFRHQTQQVVQRTQESLHNKRPRSPSVELVSQASAPAKLTRLKSNVFAENRNNEPNSTAEDRLQDLLRQLASKDAMITRLQGEVSIVRDMYQKTVKDYSSMLQDAESTTKRHRDLIKTVNEANEELVTENKTLKSFRSFEANTNASHQIWNSVSASVARRRAHAAVTAGRVGGEPGMRDFSQSHSQSMAAAVGLTTPTRRNRGASHRNLGSPSTHPNNDSSPSSRRGTSTRKSDRGGTGKKPSFPGFVNSFARPLLVAETQPQGPISKKVVNVPDEEVFLDRAAPPASQRSSSPLDARGQFSSQTENRVEDARAQRDEFARESHLNSIAPSSWSDKQLRYLWAVKTYSQGQSSLAALILAHTCQSCPNASAAKSTVNQAEQSCSTLQRLLHDSLPDDCSRSLRDEYDIAAHVLLTSLSQGTAMDAETRFEYLNHSLDYESQDSEQLSEQERSQLDEDALWECLHLMDAGLNEVLEGVTTPLRIMMAVAYKVGEFERIYDILSLLRSMAIHHPNVTRLIALPVHEQSSTRDGQDEVMDDAQPSGDVMMNETQHDVQASLQRRQRQRLDLDIDQIIVGCVQFSCSPSSQDENDRATKRLLIASAIELMESMILDVLHNDAAAMQSTHKLKAIFDHPGLLASLLDARLVEAKSIRKTLAMLTFTCQHDSLWRIALACRPDKAKVRRKSTALAAVMSEETALFEVLAKLLVDGRLEMDDEAKHQVHAAVIVFLSQFACCRPHEGLSLIASSGAILAMLVKCLQLDTDLLWNYESTRIADDERIITFTLGAMTDAVERISMDIRFMAHVFGSSAKTEQLLSRKLLAAETQLLLNGIRHYFVVALSRVAFASEPAWLMAEEARASWSEVERKSCEEAQTTFNEISDVATGLLELVLSPEEIENCWEALAEEEDEEEEEGVEDKDIGMQ